MEARQIPDKYQYQQQCLHSSGLVYATYIETVGTKVLDIKEGDIITTVCTCQQQLVEAIAAHSHRLQLVQLCKGSFSFCICRQKGGMGQRCICAWLCPQAFCISVELVKRRTVHTLVSGHMLT